MKVRDGFVSNSSSTSYMITNISDTDKTLVDFVIENPQILDEFNSEYDYHETMDKMIQGAEHRNVVFKPGKETQQVFGDEEGSTIGRVYDYSLRDGGESKNFKWRFHEYYR